MSRSRFEFVASGKHADRFWQRLQQLSRGANDNSASRLIAPSLIFALAQKIGILRPPAACGIGVNGIAALCPELQDRIHDPPCPFHLVEADEIGGVAPNDVG